MRNFWRSVLVFSFLGNFLLGLHLLLAKSSLVTVAEQPPSETNRRVGSSAPADRNPVAFVDDRLDWTRLSALDFLVLRNELTAAECPDHTAKAIVEAAIQIKYQPAFHTLCFKMSQNFWENAVTAKTSRKPPGDAEQREARSLANKLSRERDDDLKQLFGPDPRQKVTSHERFPDPPAIDSTLDFVTEAKRVRLQNQADYLSQFRRELRNQPLSAAEMSQRLADVQSAQEAERAEFLTPDEREEYRFRTSKYARFSESLHGFQPSPEENRSLIELKETYQNKIPKEEYAKLLGEERAAQFQRSQDAAYADLAKVGSYLELPDQRVIDAYDLKQRTEDAVHRIKADGSLSWPARRKALEAIRAQADQSLTATLGVAGREIYRQNGGYWIEQLVE